MKLLLGWVLFAVAAFGWAHYYVKPPVPEIPRAPISGLVTGKEWEPSYVTFRYDVVLEIILPDIAPDSWFLKVAGTRLEVDKLTFDTVQIGQQYTEGKK